MFRSLRETVLSLLLGFAAFSSVGSDFDVAVVGGGPSGIGAALAAARTGAKTVLVERDARVGGTTVSAGVVEIGLFHAWDRQVIAGPCWNLVTNAVALAGGRLPDLSYVDERKWNSGCIRVNPVVYSALTAETLERAGVTLRLNASVCGAERRTDGWRLALATDSGVGFLTARVVVDATGSASVAAFAGAERVRAPDAEFQPGSFFFYLNTREMTFDAAALERAYEKAVASGELNRTDLIVGISSFVRHGGGWGTYVPLADNSTAEAREATNRRGRELMLRLLRFIRRQPGLEKATVTHAASEVGVRETYRVVGEKTVTGADYLSGKVEPDALCWSFWFVDEHSTAADRPPHRFHEVGKVGSIPYGAMLPKGVTHLLVVGRAISSDHAANSALRVQASCMAIGQVAGCAAALCAKRGIELRQLPVADIKAALRALGALVP